MSDWLDALRDPKEGQIVQYQDRQLIVGRFYWVQPANDPDIAPGNGWEWYEQPARFAGESATGELLWNYLNQEGPSDWHIRWIGDEIVRAPDMPQEQHKPA